MVRLATEIPRPCLLIKVGAGVLLNGLQVESLYRFCKSFLSGFDPFETGVPIDEAVSSHLFYAQPESLST